MFTGIVEEIGAVREMSGHRLVIGATQVLTGTVLGDSISVNGACLTVVEMDGESFAIELSDETLARTSLGSLTTGDPVDLERAATPSTRLGGHIVQGHVDGVGVVREIGGQPEARVLRVEAPAEIARYIVEKGFIAVDGISLTVTGVEPTDVGGAAFSVAVIPYTWEHTVLGARSTGDHVNLEVDVLAKYVESLLPGRQA